uniref:Uncharacterized protein n=1 Tax=Rhizophora mucronata TaxID=61149 RepID=A0A2P2K3L5_RHIMU
MPMHHTAAVPCNTNLITQVKDSEAMPNQ